MIRLFKNKSTRKQAGASMVEQALLLSFVAVVSMSGIRTTGIHVKCKVYGIEAAVRGGTPMVTGDAAGCPGGGAPRNPLRPRGGSGGGWDNGTSPFNGNPRMVNPRGGLG